MARHPQGDTPLSDIFCTLRREDGQSSWGLLHYYGEQVHRRRSYHASLFALHVRGQ